MSARWFPNGPELTRESLAVIGGALAAAGFFWLFPTLRDFVNGNVPNPTGKTPGQEAPALVIGDTSASRPTGRQ